MKEWWNNLALREKQFLSLGALFVSMIIIYFFIWSPLENRVNALREQIQRNHELLAWMQDVDKRIQSAEKNMQASPTKPTGSLLSIMQKQINRSEFVSSLNQLHQVDVDSVQLSFQKVDFDRLIAWLTQLTQQNGLVVTQMTVTPSPTPGVVAADFVLKI